MEQLMMEQWIGIISILTGLYLGWFALLMKTENLISSIIFKFVPYVFSILNIVVALRIFNWI